MLSTKKILSSLSCFFWTFNISNIVSIIRLPYYLKIHKSVCKHFWATVFCNTFTSFSELFPSPIRKHINAKQFILVYYMSFHILKVKKMFYHFGMYGCSPFCNMFSIFSLIISSSFSDIVFFLFLAVTCLNLHDPESTIFER